MKINDQIQRIINLDLWPGVGGYKLHLLPTDPSVRWYWGEKDDTASMDNHDPPLWLHHDIAQPVYEKFLKDKLVKAGYRIARIKDWTTVTHVLYELIQGGYKAFAHADHLDALLTAAETEGVLK